MLIQSVEKLLKHHSLDSSNVQDILDEAECSRGTFYKYFHDKYDLANTYYGDRVTQLIQTACDGQG